MYIICFKVTSNPLRHIRKALSRTALSGHKKCKYEYLCEIAKFLKISLDCYVGAQVALNSHDTLPIQQSVFVFCQNREVIIGQRTEDSNKDANPGQIKGGQEEEAACHKGSFPAFSHISLSLYPVFQGPPKRKHCRMVSCRKFSSVPSNLKNISEIVLHFKKKLHKNRFFLEILIVISQ